MADSAFMVVSMIDDEFTAVSNNKIPSWLGQGPFSDVPCFMVGIFVCDG